MMTYTVEWVETKREGWKVASLKEIVEGGAQVNDVSINKTDNKGRVFPNFDAIMPGSTVAGNLWRSPTGKYTLFAPDPPKPSAGTPTAMPRAAGSSYGGGRGAAAQERTTERVREAQENKGKGVMLSASFRDATQILINHPEYQTMTFEEAQAFHKRIRAWYVAEWKSDEKNQDIPF